jgi:hypothetical protein
MGGPAPKGPPALDLGWPPIGWLAGRAWRENKSFRVLLDSNLWGVKKERALWDLVARSFGTGSRSREG